MKYVSKNGIKLTQELFYEHNKPDAPFSMRDANDGEGSYVARSGKKYKSLPYVFRHAIDEYDAAMSTLGSWEHWQKLCGLKWFLEGNVNNCGVSGLLVWREEMKLRDESKTKKLLMEQAEDGNVAAMRYLNESAKKIKAGRPQKQKAQKESTVVSSLAQRMNEIKQG